MASSISQRLIALSRLAARKHRVRRRRGGFTLVEVLVVVGIIALLISILLPTLTAARRAADNAACLSNLRQIGQATIMYKTQYGRIPFFFVLRNYPWQPVAPDGTGNTLWWTAFSQGGMTTHSSISVGYMDDWSKPLNQFLWRNESDTVWAGAKTAPQLRSPRDVFRCPADKPGEGMGRGVGLPVNYLGPTVASPYELYGTSYMCNRGFMYDPEILNLYYQVMTPPLTYEKVNFFNKGVSKIVMHWPSSETYVASDIWFLWSLFYHQAVPGAHSKQSIHNAVFLDGHAAPAYVTARDIQNWGPYIPGQYAPHSGDGWHEAGSGTWGRTTSYVGGPQNINGKVPWKSTDPFAGGTAGGLQ